MISSSSPYMVANRVQDSVPLADLLDLRLQTGITTGATFTWADQSPAGNDAVQSVSNDQPTDDGASGVTFDGADDLVLTNSFNTAASWTKLMRFTLTDSKTFHNLWGTSEENAGDLFWVSDATGEHLLKSASGGVYAQVAGTTDLAQDGTIYTYAMTVENTDVAEGTFEIWNLTSGTAVSEHRVTGALKSTDTSTTDHIGNWASANVNGLQGSIHQVRGYSSILSDSELEAVVATF